ncbi:Isoprenyl transferase, partial [Tetrabaena socialis]
VYGFSTENWGRSREEVGFLMRLLQAALESELPQLHADGVRLAFAGDRALLPESLRRTLQRAEELTADNTAMVLCVCLSYGGRQDIARAAQELCRLTQQGKLAPEEVTESLLAQHLSTHAARAAVGCDPDLLIRTSGEQRLSNFLLFELAYTELYFTNVFWPDFDRAEWQSALNHYASRQRRFGRRRGGVGHGRHTEQGAAKVV